MNLEKIAVTSSSSVAFVLVVIKIIIWLTSWSIAVLSSAIDSLLDLVVSLFNYFAIKSAQKPADEKFNYGRWKTEALASFLEWLVIIISWIYIFYESILKIISWEKISDLWPAIYVMIFSIFMTFSLVTFLNYVYKKTGNLVVEADSFHYKTDLYTNVWILASLFIIKITNFYYIDWIIWIIISIYIITSAFQILKKWYFMVLDISLSEEIVDKIKNILENEPDLSWYHFLKTRKSAKTNFVQAHLVFKDINITLIKAHNISDKIECKIIWIENDRDWIVDFHLDPYDDKNFEENNRVCKI
jgi:cation diffusion facilitator family transporter